MKRISAIIVDDEDGAVQTLRGMIEAYCTHIHLVATATSLEQGIAIAHQFDPDLVFLDIEMPPQGSGFDFLRQTADLHFGVIFTTAHAHYAVQAINTAHPWAYLIKPYQASDLINAVQIAFAKMLESAEAKRTTASMPRGLLLPDLRKGQVVVHFTDLVCCFSEASCTVFHYFDDNQIEQLSVYKTLREIEAELPAHLFCRVHHGAIVNMAYIRRFERIGRSGRLYLNGDLIADISAQKMDNFTQQFDLFMAGNMPHDTRRGHTLS